VLGLNLPNRGKITGLTCRKEDGLRRELFSQRGKGTGELAAGEKRFRYVEKGRVWGKKSATSRPASKILPEEGREPQVLSAAGEAWTRFAWKKGAAKSTKVAFFSRMRRTGLQKRGKKQGPYVSVASAYSLERKSYRKVRKTSRPSAPKESS